MRLIIIRHGEANNPVLDPRKGLSIKGVAQAEEIAGFLRMQQDDLHEIWHSPKERAAQTAGIIAQILGLKSATVKRNDLNPNSSVEPVAAEITAQKQNVIIVSHLPFVDRLAGFMTGGNADAGLFRFTTCTALCLQKSDSWLWKIQWMVSPDNFA